MPPIIIYHFIKKKYILLPTIFYKTISFNYEIFIVKTLFSHCNLAWKFHRTQLLS